MGTLPIAVALAQEVQPECWVRFGAGLREARWIYLYR